uniref:Receptor accessory protein 4 n=1 Tax=Molossus molossus TaxID=27622 RepID=A0A7J8IC17_MOLMO|nr:receptor accessory protein 4 [Molossus molossus]
MQDLRSIPNTHAPNYQDPLYLEDQMPRHRPPIGEWAEPLSCPKRAGFLHASCGFPHGSASGLQTVNAKLCFLGLPLLHAGFRAGGLQDTDTEDECWSDTEVVPQPPSRLREKPLSRSQSLRMVKKKPLGTSRSLKVRTRKKTVPSDMSS